MNADAVCLDAFCCWLCAHEDEIVGCPASCYHSPLARWLSECFHAVYGVDGMWFGRALYDYQCWRLLPRWAVLFSSALERVKAPSVTGLQALAVLAYVELALSSRAA